MKLLSNGTESFRTGDAIADAVLDYALALSQEQDAASVTIPTASGLAETTQLTLVIGWGLPLSVVDLDGANDLIDEECVRSIRRSIEARVPRGDALLSSALLVAMDLDDL